MFHRASEVRQPPARLQEAAPVRSWRRPRARCDLESPMQPRHSLRQRGCPMAEALPGQEQSVHGVGWLWRGRGSANLNSPMGGDYKLGSSAIRIEGVNLDGTGI